MLKKKKVVFKVLNINFDTSTPTGKLMQTMLAAVAEFEREMMLESQAEGIRIAKAKGKFKGRKPAAREKSGSGFWACCKKLEGLAQQQEAEAL